MSNYDTIISALTVLPKGDTIYSEMATKIYLDDEAAGLFVVVEQCHREGGNKILINAEEWPAIRAAINSLMDTCNEKNAKDVS